MTTRQSRPSSQPRKENYKAENEDRWPPELILLREENGKRNTRQLWGSDTWPTTECTPTECSSSWTATVCRPREQSTRCYRISDCRRGSVLTSNERIIVKGPGRFEWIKLRFGQRHLSMCSVSLSRKLLCLTGRLSMFRGDVATNPSFINQIENDCLEHWLFGEYRMFSGDDKSSWFWLVSHGYDMIYVPDAMVTTYEEIEGHGFTRWSPTRSGGRVTCPATADGRSLSGRGGCGCSLGFARSTSGCRCGRCLSGPSPGFAR